MGLLDSLFASPDAGSAQPSFGGLLGSSPDDPRSALIMNLAAGMMQGNMGAGLAAGSKAYQDARDGILKRQDMAQQIKLRDMQFQMLQRKQDMLSNFLNPGAGSGSPAQPGQPSQPAIEASPGGGLGSGTFGIPMGGQPATAAPQSQPQGGGIMGQMTPDMLAKLKLGADVDLADIWKIANVPNKMDAGAYYSRAGGPPQYLPDPTKGVTLDRGGNISRMGGSDNIAGMAGDLARAQEAAKDKFAPPVTIQTPSGPRLMTPGQARGLTGDASASPPPMSPLANLPRPETGVNGNFSGDPAQAMEAVMGIKDPQERSNAYAALVRQITDSKGSNLPGFALQTTAEAKVGEAKGEAAVNAAKIKASTEPLLSAIDQALAINPKVPYGSFGIADARRNLSNLPLVGDGQASKYAGQWDQLMGQNIMNGIASSGLGRMDIPIVNAIKSANGIPMENHPDARKEMLMTLRNLVLNHAKSAENTVPALNEPGITTNTSSQPMKSVQPLPVPMKGMVRNGYRFTGGDPSSPTSWEKQ